jgi:hypothetical protein
LTVLVTNSCLMQDPEPPVAMLPLSALPAQLVKQKYNEKLNRWRSCKQFCGHKGA